jgi:hypothetical protein
MNHLELVFFAPQLEKILWERGFLALFAKEKGIIQSRVKSFVQNVLELAGQAMDCLALIAKEQHINNKRKKL